MDTYEIKEKDLKEIKSLTEISSSIHTLYKKLFYLENNGQKESSKYNQILEYLNIAVEVEQKQYEKVNLYALKAFSWGTYLLHDLLSEDVEDCMESILNQNYKDIEEKRIINVLAKCCKSDAEFMKERISPSIAILLSIIIPDSKELMNTYHKGVAIHNIIEEEISYLYLFFLEETLKEITDENLKQRLIRSKYQMSFLYQHVEDLFLKYHFSVPNTIFQKSKIMTDSIKKDEHSTSFINFCCKNTSLSQIVSLLEMNDFEEEEEKKDASFLLRKCLLRSTFLLMNEQSIAEVNYMFHDIIEKILTYRNL